VVLIYHVVLRKVMAADVVKLKTAKDCAREEVKIDASKWHLRKTVKINDANVVKADVGADNGVIHVIDKALLPK
jgi:uncharacterized surface protein with fasciclin (FAS1) repeats